MALYEWPNITNLQYVAIKARSCTTSTNNIYLVLKSRCQNERVRPTRWSLINQCGDLRPPPPPPLLNSPGAPPAYARMSRRLFSEFSGPHLAQCGTLLYGLLRESAESLRPYTCYRIKSFAFSFSSGKRSI